jgi:signal transduction histidine kinase
MERYGGRATIRSSPGAGTEVELVLPLKTAQ